MAYDGTGSLSLNLFHPWLGLIYISIPGIQPDPGTLTSYPDRRFILPVPVSPSEPGGILSHGETLVWPYESVYVFWITRFQHD